MLCCQFEPCCWIMQCKILELSKGKRMLIQHAINLGLLTLLFFVLGMIKPKWPLFFLAKPTRYHVTVGTTIFVMIFMTMYGQGRKEAELAKKHKKPVEPSSVPTPAPAPVPVPVQAPAPTPKTTK